jgi:hypothetical protein
VSRRRWPLIALAAAGLVGLVGAVVGSAGDTAVPPPAQEAVRLGPAVGEPVAGYLAALPARLPPASAAPVPALVQLRAGLTTDQATSVLAGSGARTVSAVFRVPLPRVQAALRFERLTPVDLADPAAALRRQLALAQDSARRAAADAGRRLAGRQGELARYEAGALAGRCRCVLAVLVVADRAGLAGLAGRPGVRAVDAAPAGTEAGGVALSPLLPEQTTSAGPVPDDGPVPVSSGAPG